MKHVSLMGYIYRLSDRNYWKLLRLIAKDQPWNLDELGKQICSLDKNVTDMSAGDAQMELDWHKSEKVED